jgi:DNA invertase Pin-like site-specific DNA recombinase
MKTEKTYRIALYVRASTEEQCTVEGTLKNQEERLRGEVRYRNQSHAFGEIAAVYVDAGKSAKDMKRPELQKMLRAVKRKEINLVMVTELSRLSRSVKDFVTMNDFFRDHGCKFASLRDQYDTSTAGGEMVMLVMANLAQYERRQVSERVSANFKARAERGLYNGGQVPMGYKLLPEKRGYLAIDEEAAGTVRAAFLKKRNHRFFSNRWFESLAKCWALSRYKRTIPAGRGSPFRRAMGEEEGRSRGAGNPATVWPDDSGGRCSLKHRKNVRRDGASKS